MLPSPTPMPLPPPPRPVPDKPRPPSPAPSPIFALNKSPILFTSSGPVARSPPHGELGASEAFSVLSRPMVPKLVASLTISARETARSAVSPLMAMCPVVLAVGLPALPSGPRLRSAGAPFSPPPASACCCCC